MNKGQSGLVVFFLVIAVIFAAVLYYFYPENESLEANAAEAPVSIIEKRVHELVNEERTFRKLPKLKWDEKLAKIARAHSEDMVKNSFYGHEDMQGNNFAARYQKAGYECRQKKKNTYYEGSENAQITLDTGKTMVFKEEHLNDIGTAEEISQRIVKSWMNSPEHRANILSEIWEAEGVGISRIRDFGIDPNDRKVFNTELGRLQGYPSIHDIYAIQNFC